jgi:hypothetical protein
MQKYADINNDSGVDSFEINGSSITVCLRGHQGRTLTAIIQQVSIM